MLTALRKGAIGFIVATKQHESMAARCSLVCACARHCLAGYHAVVRSA
jgi:hypothetical protein